MPNVALVETKRSKTNFQKYLGLEFDQFQLCSDPAIKKVLKRDVDIQMDPDEYDWIILIGSDATKYYTKINSVTEYSGKLLEGKYLPLINPSALAFKPEIKPLWESSIKNVLEYISGELEDTTILDEQALGIQDTEQANEWLRNCIDARPKYVALDSETTGLYPRDGHMLGISLSYEADYGVYIDVDCFNVRTEVLLQKLFNHTTVIFHNAKFDIAFFEYHFNFEFPKFEDTMLLHYLADENPGTHGLKQLAMKYTKYGDYEKEQYTWIADYCKRTGTLRTNFTWDTIPFNVMRKYAAMDAVVTLLVFHEVKGVKDNSKLLQVYDNILIPGVKFLLNVQDNGVPFDKERLYKAQELMQNEIDDASSSLSSFHAIKKFEQINGKDFNPNSTVQLRSLLFDFMGLTPTGIKTGTGAESTNAEVLQELASQSDVPRLILDLRQRSKIKNTYLDKIIPQLDRDSRLRTGFNLHGTTSGRLSSSGKLNMQQLPRDNSIVKGCIKARDAHKIVAMDLTTAEVYVAAVLAKDKSLQEVFRAGGNFHSQIAKRVFKLSCEVEDVATMYPGQRQAAKAVSFGIMYGAGPKKISEQVTKDGGIPFSQREAASVINDYFEEFHALKAWIEKNKKFIKQNGFIYSFFGRKRRLPNVTSTDKAIQSHSIRSGLNFLVQSTASDINLLGAIDMDKHIQKSGFKSKIFALVHDSILAEVPFNEVDYYCEALKDFVQKSRGLIIPGAPIGCDFEIGDDYSMGKFAKQYGTHL